MKLQNLIHRLKTYKLKDFKIFKSINKDQNNIQK